MTVESGSMNSLIVPSVTMLLLRSSSTVEVDFIDCLCLPVFITESGCSRSGWAQAQHLPKTLKTCKRGFQIAASRTDLVWSNLSLFTTFYSKGSQEVPSYMIRCRVSNIYCGIVYRETWWCFSTLTFIHSSVFSLKISSWNCSPLLLQSTSLHKYQYQPSDHHYSEPCLVPLCSWGSSQSSPAHLKHLFSLSLSFFKSHCASSNTVQLPGGHWVESDLCYSKKKK